MLWTLPENHDPLDWWIDPNRCFQCGGYFRDYADTCTTGYGIDSESKMRYCFPCCAVRESERMIKFGKTDLYLVDSKNAEQIRITDWPGKLSFNVVYLSRSKCSGFGGYMDRRNVRFIGPDGYFWTGRNQGDMDIVRCKRTKKKALSGSDSGIHTAKRWYGYAELGKREIAQ